MYRRFKVAKAIDVNKLTSSQLDGFFIGCLLGDGCIRKERLSFNFSSVNEDFVNFVEHIIKTNTNFKYTRKIQKNNNRDGYVCKDSHIIEIYSEKEYFRKIHKLIYQDGKRVITPRLLAKINYLTLAIWYMSDGFITLNGIKSGYIKKRIVGLSTHAYTQKENETLASFFREGLDIHAGVRKHGKYYFIGFPVKEAQKLFQIIFPYAFPSMYYKFDLAYSDDHKNLIDAYKPVHDIVKALRSQEFCDMI